MVEKVKITGTVSDFGNGDNPRQIELELNVSLRDLFAAFALAGLASVYPQGGKSYADTAGPMAYEYADAAIAAREGME